MALKHSYSLLAPLYDVAVKGPLGLARRRSLSRLQNVEGKAVLINGIGTGLDLDYLPTGAQYTGSDITPSMLNRDSAVEHRMSAVPQARRNGSGPTWFEYAAASYCDSHRCRIRRGAVWQSGPSCSQ